MHFSFILNNFPDWAVPMTRIVPVFKIPDAYDFEELDFFSDYFFVWEKISDNTYELNVDVEGEAEKEGNPIALTLDLDLVFVNERNYYNTQSNKK